MNYSLERDYQSDTSKSALLLIIFFYSKFENTPLLLCTIALPQYIIPSQLRPKINIFQFSSSRMLRISRVEKSNVHIRWTLISPPSPKLALRRLNSASSTSSATAISIARKLKNPPRCTNFARIGTESRSPLKITTGGGDRARKISRSCYIDA